MANLHSQYTYDAELELKEAGAVTASADNEIIDLGEGISDGFVVIDLSACKVTVGDEIYTVSVEASNVAAMDSGSVCVAKKVFGNLVVPMDAALSAPGRYVIPFRNEECGTIYRYVRLSNLVAGTSPSITYSAFIAKR